MYVGLPLKMVTLFKRLTWFVFTAFVFSVSAAQAADVIPAPEGSWNRLEDGRLQINIMKVCGTNYPCKFSIGSIRVDLEGSWVSMGIPALTSIEANLPISSVHISSFGNSKVEIKEQSISIFKDGRTFATANVSWLSFAKPLKKKIEIGPDIYTTDIVVDAGIFNLAEDLKGPTLVLALAVQYNLNRAHEFRSGISKADHKHVDRLIAALQSTLFLISDSKGWARLPITHDLVREHMRLIMVLATVLNELFQNYDQVKAIQKQVEDLSSLSTQIRSAYGWPEGLAGTSSKAMTALSELVDLEFSLLYGDDPIPNSTEIYNQLRLANRAIGSTVAAASGGDTRAVGPTQIFADIWNSDAWQSRLNSLFKLPIPTARSDAFFSSLYLLLTGVENMSELTNVKFKFPPELENRLRK